PAVLEPVAAGYREGGWTARVDGDPLTAPFSAQSEGPPPWHVYRLAFRTAVGVATAEPFGASHWTVPACRAHAAVTLPRPPRADAARACRCGSGEQAGGGDRLGRTGGVDDAAGGPPVAVVDVPSADLDDGDGAAPHRQRDFRQRPPGTADGDDGVGGVDDDVVAGLAEAGGQHDGQVGPGGGAVGGG